MCIRYHADPHCRLIHPQIAVRFRSSSFSADIFSQNEVENIADSPHSQLELIDRFAAGEIAEINRKVASAVADLHFAPTRTSKENLLREGVDPNRIIVTGNPVIDALHSIVERRQGLAGTEFEWLEEINGRLLA